MPPDLAAWISAFRAGDRAALGRALSLVESTSPADRPAARAMVEALLPHAGNSWRIGITGLPGAGKSTFIEALGLRLADAGKNVAVLAIDPSSTITGGSVLGDRTRMPRLSAHPRAFIRPSPSRGTLGGVAAATRQAVLLCQAAGYHMVLIETVGVGQSETRVADMTDAVLALTIPGGGDELQGIKRGLLERVDVLAVNKAEGEIEPRARAAALQLSAAARLLHALSAHAPPASSGAPRAHPPPAQADLELPAVLCCSAQTGAGVAEVWAALESRLISWQASGRLGQRRREQDLRWLDELLWDRLAELLAASPPAADALASARAALQARTTTPLHAADAVISAFLAGLAGRGVGPVA